jgi:[NiFe] hydrogenase large subunit
MPKPSDVPRGKKKKKEDPTSPPPPPPEPDPVPPPEPDPSPGGGQRIVVDPITRVEGHLRIEVEVSSGQVSKAWSTGTLFRGIETILRGRNPEDAWLFTQRLCGVCTYVHGASSVRCVEDAAGVTIPDNARAIRNLIMGAQYLHDHIVHFYHLHALDWVDMVSALDADPGATAALARQLSPLAPAIDFVAVQQKLASFINGGQLGPFANAYWGHEAYWLNPEENLLFAAHYLEALKVQVNAARMHAIFGGKNPHVQSLRVGGVTCRHDITATRIGEFRDILHRTRAFIDTVYVPDAKYLARIYGAWGSFGGFNNFLACGEFPRTADEPGSLLFPRGVIFDRGPVQSLDPADISEHVRHSWYQGENALHPAADRYSWLKAPRYLGEPMEVGPLARMLVAYGSGMPEAKAAIDGFLNDTELQDFSVMYSVIGRTAARALETQIIAHAMDDWLDRLSPGSSAYQPTAVPLSGTGMGLNEAPRGALGHWIDIQSQQIGNYQMVVPSTWNFGPRCAGNKPGPIEQVLVGIPVVDLAKPLEILRAVHSLDPCIACAVHVIDPDNDWDYEIRVL